MTGLTYEEMRARLVAGHAYDPASERDACGVGLVCAIDGRPRREVVDLAIRSLKAHGTEEADQCPTEAPAPGGSVIVPSHSHFPKATGPLSTPFGHPRRRADRGRILDGKLPSALCLELDHVPRIC